MPYFGLTPSNIERNSAAKTLTTDTMYELLNVGMENSRLETVSHILTMFDS